MKKSVVGCFVLGMLCLVWQAGAAEAERAADHEALRALRKTVEQSLNAGDMKKLRTCLAKNFTFIASDQTVITNTAGITAYWDGMFKNEASPVTAMTVQCTAGIPTEFIGPDHGFCRGTSREVYTLRSKRKVAVTTTWSVVLVKEAGAWKIQTAHTAVNFMDNPVLAAAEMSWFGRLCVGLGLKKLPGETAD